ncbi:MAG TPA: patatin-like phospholipase family protein [Pyrinomonadaceae bacterium]|jgi:predicted acylesterase/phospholipase RssA
MTERDLAITFAGGGNRSFYQLGLMNRWRETLLPRIAAIAACSAGACVATLMLSGREREVKEFWERRREGVMKNFEWRRLLSGQRPTPHEPIYRDTLQHAFDDGGFEAIKAQPFPILILTTAFPRYMPGLAAALLGLCSYDLEKKLKRELIHPSFGRRVGFRPLVFDARDCRSPAELVDLIIATSATPPFTSVGSFGGRRLLDGGIIDNVPAFLADDVPGVARNLVLLTRPYPPHVIGRQGARLYVAPAETLPVERWDYTRPELVEATISIGERDADSHSSRLSAFLVD